MTAVFDTNVLLAAIITEGICSKLLRRARMREFSLASCPFIIKELRTILARKFRLSHTEIAAAMEPVSEAIDQVIDHSLKITGICRDSDDDNIIACALASKAACLVTGDSDLLELNIYEGIKIITPRDFEALFL